MKFAKIWKVGMASRTKLFQMMSVWCYTLVYEWRPTREGTMGFNVTGGKTFHDMVSHCHFQLSFEKVPFVDMGHDIKEEYSRLSEKSY